MEPDTPAGRVQLGEYIIEEKIGAGGMGQVYRARQPSLDRMVALKLLPRSVASDRESVDRFKREAKSAAQLVHPNIVQIYTVGDDRGVPYFAMEYVIGEDLEHRLKRGDRFTVEEAVGIVASVAMALACAEEAGIVHRDIKPGNIMIDSHGVVKVTDFGLAKAVKLIEADITQAGFIVGTPSYMAPEQGQAGTIDHRTDIYSLGAVFYELLCARPLFQADDPASLIYMHVHKVPDPPSSIRKGIPEEVDHTCLKCLAKGPDDRFQSATELLSELVEVQEKVAATVPDDDEGTIVFDRRMANVLISGHVPAKTVEAGEPGATPPSTEETMLMSTDEAEVRWSKRYWPAVVGGGAAVVALVVAFILAVTLGGGEETSTGGTAGGGPTPPGRAIEQAPPGSPVLPLSALRGMLPEGTRVEVQIGGGLPYEVSQLEDQAVEPGPVKLEVSREHYKDIVHEFDMKEGGPALEFSEDMFRLEPDEAFAKLIGEAESLIDKKDFSAAEDAIERIALEDASAPVLQEIKERLAKAKADWNRHWSAVFEEAKGLSEQGKTEDARKLLVQVPVGHVCHDDAKELLEGFADTKARIIEGRAKIERHISKGEFKDGRATYDVLVSVRKIPPEKLLDLAEGLEKGERLEKEAAAARKAEHYGAALVKYKELALLAPKSVSFSDAVRDLEGMIRRMDRSKGLAASAEGHMARKEFKSARGIIEELRTVDEAKARELLERLATQEAEHELTGFLALLDRALAALDAEGLALLIDPESQALAKSARESVGAFARCSMRFGSPSRHRLDGLTLRADAAEARVKWDFTVDVPSARRRVVGSEDLRFIFRKRAEGWRLSKVEAGPLPAFKLLGGGAGGGDTSEKRIQGRVTKVEGSLVTIDRGSGQGVKVKMVFTLYCDARVVRMPLVESRVVVVEEEKVGEWRVVEVSANECLATYVGDPADMKLADTTMLAVASPIKSVAAAPPVIKRIRADRTIAGMGGAVTVELDVSNVDRVHVCYLWEADGGLLNPSRTTVPKTTWTAPRQLGEYTVRVRAVSPLGASSVNEMKLRSEGAPSGPAGARARKIVLAGEIPIAAPFVAAGDLAFDEANRAYLLDGRALKLLVFSPQFGLVSVSRPYRGKALRIKTARDHVYVLEARAVKRYAIGKDTFASPAGASYGKPGQGNGTFTRPVDFAISAEGEVAVLDSTSCTVQVFGAHGRFVASFGAKGRAGGELLQPKAIVCACRGTSHAYYVLDAGRRQVLVFSPEGYAGEFPVGTPKGELTDLAYDPVGDRLLVLDGKRCEVLVYTMGGAKLPMPAVRPRKTPARSRSVPLGELCSPSRIVCDGTSHMYVLCGEKSQMIDRFELPGEEGATAVFAGRMSSVAPTTFTRAAASPDGTLYLVDHASGLLWQLGRGAWRSGSLGGPGVAATWSKAVDVAADASGDFYVLDVSTVHRFSSMLVRQKRFGKRGKAAERDGLDGTVGIAGSVAGAARSAGAPWGAGEFVAVLLGARQFGVHLFLREGTAQAPFPDKARSRPGTSIAIGADGMVHVGSSGVIESFGVDGSPRHVTKLPIGEPSRLAASADGTVYALEMGRRPKLVGVRPEQRKVTVQFDIPRTIRSPSDIACDGYGTLYLLEGRARKVHVLKPAAAGGRSGD